MTIRRGRRSFSQEVTGEVYMVKGTSGGLCCIVQLEQRATEKAFIISVLFNDNYL